MIRPISEGDAWVTNDDGDIIGIQLHGRSEVVDLSNPVNGKVDPVTGGIGILVGGKELGAKLGATSITYDSQGRVSTHDGWTMTYGASGRASSQTKGTQTQTFNYDAAGRFTGVTES